MSKSPFHGLARTASCEMQGERFVAVATESLCTQALCACSSTGYKTQASAWAVLLKEDAGHREASYCYKARWIPWWAAIWQTSRVTSHNRNKWLQTF